MKRLDLSRDVKRELWQLFAAGHAPTALTLRGDRIDPAALAKQHALWTAWQERHPNRTEP